MAIKYHAPRIVQQTGGQRQAVETRVRFGPYPDGDDGATERVLPQLKCNSRVLIREPLVTLGN